MAKVTKLHAKTAKAEEVENTSPSGSDVAVKKDALLNLNKLRDHKSSELIKMAHDARGRRNIQDDQAGRYICTA